MQQLVPRLLSELKAYAGAELDVVRQTGLAYVRSAIPGVVLGTVAVLLALATLPVLVAAIGVALARWLGIAGGLFAAVALVLLVAGLLGWTAMRRLNDIGRNVG